MKELFFYTKWAVKRIIFRKKIPLSSTLILTDKCNLHCKHCVVAHLGYTLNPFESVKQDLEKLYSLGSRMLVITGGEPFVWKDSSYNVEDIVSYAKHLGFFRVVICTNGTFKLNSNADYLWVSMDGNEIEHNNLRGGGVFSEVYKNVSESSHQNICVNFVISKINYADFERAIERILSIEKIKGILVYLYTPYVGLGRELMLDEDEKKDAIFRMLKLKRKHFYRIFNTLDGLKAFKSDKWERPVWGSVTINRGEVTNCCCRKGIFDEYTCKNCGIAPSVEMYILQKMKPLAILENLKFLRGRR